MEESDLCFADERKLILAASVLGGLIANTNIPEATPMSELIDRSLEIADQLVARLCPPENQSGESSTSENQATLPLSADV